MNGLTALLQAAASNLSGHTCRVRWRRPARTDARALCFKSGNLAVIDLHPNLAWEGDELLYTIAHEAGHVRDLWHEWGEGITDLPSGSITPPTWANDLPGIKQVEAVADNQAERWLKYAKENYMRFIVPGAPNDEFTLYLRALANWRK